MTLTISTIVTNQNRKDDAVPIYKLQFIKDSNERKLTDEEARLLEFSRRIDIHMMGVWDTVGALGVPWTGMPVIGRDQFHFHNPNLSKIYKHAYQALAVDDIAALISRRYGHSSSQRLRAILSTTCSARYAVAERCRTALVHWRALKCWRGTRMIAFNSSAKLDAKEGRLTGIAFHPNH